MDTNKMFIDDFIQKCKDTIDELCITTANNIQLSDIKICIKVYDGVCGLELSLHSPDYDGQVYLTQVLTLDKSDEMHLPSLLLVLHNELRSRDQNEILSLGELD